MRTRLFRTLSIVFSLLLLVSVPVQANPIKFFDVVNVMGDLQNRGQIQTLRMRASLQDPTVNAGTKTQPNTTTSTSGSTTVAIDPLVSSLVSSTDVAAASLVDGTEIAGQQPQSNVQVFQQDNIDGTICDCGEIPAVGGGIPWWPFLALIPLVCVTGVCSHHECPDCSPPCIGCSPNPQCIGCTNPTPSPSPSVGFTPQCIGCNNVPEPTSLLLFGSGVVALTAGVRRRLNKMRVNKQSESTTEV